MKRWLLLPPLFAVGLVAALHAAAGVKDANVIAKVTLNAGGGYDLYVENTGSTTITSFSFISAPTLHVTGIASATKGSCQVNAAGFVCTTSLAPPPCACNPGENMTVSFNGSGEVAGSKVQVDSTVVTVTGTGSVGTTTTATTTQTTTATTTTTTTAPPPPPPKVEKLAGRVGPGAKIALARSAKAGKATITIRDMSKKDNFHLIGHGVNKKTGVAFRGTVKWTVTLRSGTYAFRSDAHKKKLHGSLKVK
jgi:hypothetical protein